MIRTHLLPIVVGGMFFASCSLVWLLYPKQPQLTDNSSYQEQRAGYRAGGADCQPSAIDQLPEQERAGQTEACQLAAEQHRLQQNDLLQQQRSADAANAMALLAFQQTGIAAWGLGLGFITMAAAIAAAKYARDAAIETKRTADTAERALESDIRPVLTFSNFEYAGNQLHYTFRVNNVGNGPARIKEIKVEVDRSPRDGEQPSTKTLSKIPLPSNPIIMPETSLSLDVVFGALAHLYRMDLLAILIVGYEEAIANKGTMYFTSMKCSFTLQYQDADGGVYMALGQPPAGQPATSAAINIDPDGWVIT